MLPMEAITFKGRPCLSLDVVWSALHTTFNSAIDQDTDVLWVFPGLLVRDECLWLDFSLAEMMEALAGLPLVLVTSSRPTSSA